MSVYNKLTRFNENLLQILILGIQGWRRQAEEREEWWHFLWGARAQKGW